MSETSSFIVCGLPGSGKTTFLAALWHVVQSGESEPALKLSSLEFAEYDYVNEIRERWLKGEQQSRTVGAARTIGIDLEDKDGAKARLLFPDHSGETFEGMWTNRTCSEDVAEQISSRTGTLLFLRQSLKQPTPLMEVIATEAEMAAAMQNHESEQAPIPIPRDWEAEGAPDQVKLVDTLQIITDRFPVGQNEKLAIFVSAWDLAEEKSTPEGFIETEMPLLHQYLRHGEHKFDIRFYGVSAQGGEYVEEGYGGDIPSELETLLDLDTATARVQLSYDGSTSTDLTEPIKWLMT